jgi:serine/threonine protein kinase
VEIGLIDAAELQRYAADSAEGVLGLSRALVKAGRLTSYQAAAAYQRKSRGLLVGNYLILDKLGRGGMGLVFKARHRTLGRVGALKILPPSFTRDRGAVLRFRREFEAAGRLRHPNLVAAFEADEDRGVHFLVMEYVQGINLDRLIGEQGPLPVAEAIDYLIQSARGLEAAHEQGIIHRDIKPGNLMLDPRGTIRVLDLGLARIVSASSAFDSSACRLTQADMYIGTVDYMAPEQAEDPHNVDHRADIYSLGCTLYFLLTGREPFPGPTILRRLVAHQDHPAPSLRAIRPDVAPALEAAYQKMMAKRPDDRPGSMSGLIALLHASRPSSEDTGPVAPPPESGLAQAVTNPGPLERSGPTRTTIDSAIFVRRMVGADTLCDRELNLRDLVMDVPADVSGTGETGGDRDASQGPCDVQGWSLRELAQELGEAVPRALAPKPSGADAPPPSRTAAPRQPGALPAAPQPSAADAQPPSRTAAPRQPGALPAASPPPAADRQPRKQAAVLRHEGDPPAASKLPAVPRQPRKPAAMRPGDSTPNAGVAILVVVTVILLVMALVLALAH